MMFNNGRARTMEFTWGTLLVLLEYFSLTTLFTLIYLMHLIIEVLALKCHECYWKLGIIQAFENYLKKIQAAFHEPFHGKKSKMAVCSIPAIHPACGRFTRRVVIVHWTSNDKLISYKTPSILIPAGRVLPLLRIFKARQIAQGWPIKLEGWYADIDWDKWAFCP